MAENPKDAYFKNPDSPGLAKQAAGLVGTLAMWGIGLAAAHQVLRRGKTSLLKGWAKYSKTPAVKAAAQSSLDKFSSSGGSLSHFYADVGGPGSQALRSLRYAAEEAPLISAYTKLRKTTNVFDRAAVLKGRRPIRVGGKDIHLNKENRTELYQSFAAKYTREMATISPLFYAAEQVTGGHGQSAHQRDGENNPAWYNVPGHAVNFAKWLPQFAAFDIAARGAFKGIPYAYHSVMSKGIRPDSLRHLTLNVDKSREALSKTTQDNVFIQAKASWDSFKHMVGTRRTPSNKDRLINSGGGTSNFINWAKGNLTKFSKKKDEYAAQYVKDLQNVTQSTSRYIAGDTFTSLVSPHEGIAKGYENVFSLMKHTGGLGPEFRKRMSDLLFSRDRSLMPTLAKYGGLEDLRLGHLKEAGMDKQYGDILHTWDNARTVARTKPKRSGKGKTRRHRKTNREYDSLFKGGSADRATKPTHTKDDLLMSKDLFWDPASKKIVDLTNTRGYDVLGRVTNSLHKKLSLFDRVPALDLFPLKAIVGYNMPEFIVASKSVIPQRSKTDIIPEGYSKKSIIFPESPGVFIKDGGKRTYTLYSRPVTKGAYGVGATNLYGMSRFDSQKMAKVMEYMEGIGRPKIDDVDKDIGPLRSWLFRQTNIGGGSLTKDRESGFAMGMAHWKGDSRAWAILKDDYGLRNIKSVANFIDDADTALKLGQLDNVFMQARRDAFQTLGKDDVWKKIMGPLLGQDKGGKTIVKGIHGTYNMDDLLRDKPSKDGIVPIMDVLEKLFSKRGAGGQTRRAALRQDTPSLDTIRDLIKYDQTYRGTGELPSVAARRAFTEYHIQTNLLKRKSTLTYGAPTGQADASGNIADVISGIQESIESVTKVIDDVLNNNAMAKTSLITRKEKTAVDMAVQGLAWEETLRNIGYTDEVLTGRASSPRQVIGNLFSSSKELTIKQHNEATFLTKFLTKMSTTSVKQPEGSPVQFTKLWDDYSKSVGRWRTLDIPRTESEASSIMQESLRDNPYFWFNNDAATWGKSIFHYGAETFNTVMDMIGVGWDRAQYKTLFGSKTGVLNLWGRRLALAGGVAGAYQAVDTLTDANPLLDGTALDEGVTVALADQAVRARMIAGHIYDFTGVTSAMKYMEGLMPKSSKILPGAAAGFAIGGIPGMITGGILNSYIQPTLAESPLSFLSILPPVAPFVADLTRSHAELRDLYSGRDWEEVRRGQGWPLGNQPIEGGRVTQMRPNWFHLLKSQAAASPVLYGSKVEQFLFKDLPLLDFSFGDLIDPHYLERKHGEDRPYPVPDIPFQEIPILGPAIAATLGKAYLALHPLGSNTSPNEAAAIEALSGGFGFNQEEGFGPKYSGAYGEQFDNNNSDLVYGTATGRAPIVQSPYSTHQVLAEQIYKGVIEPPGLLGWATSTALWGGDEPYVDEPVFSAASAMDSFSRRYWDMQLGDPLLLTEGFRRLVPRPRTSREEVNPLRNRMPNWMPEEYQYGDPYCLTPETMVETITGLIRADSIKEGTLIRTIHGRYFPVSRVKARPVKEKVYRIKIEGSNHILSVTGEHPFYTCNADTNKTREFVQAKNLQVGDYTVYPLLKTPPDQVIKLRGTPSARKGGGHLSIPVNSYTSTLMALMTKYGYIDKHKHILMGATEASTVLFDEVVEIVFGKLPNWPLMQLQQLIDSYGIPPQLFSAPLNIFSNYLEQFVSSIDEWDRVLKFDFPNNSIAYQAWSIMLQNNVIGLLDGNTIECPNWHVDIHSSNARKIQNKLLWFNITGLPETQYSTRIVEHVKSPIRVKRKEIYFKIQSIDIVDYDGDVYGYQIDTDDTFCVAGCVVHNTRIPSGEVLLPGSGFESVADVTMDFPTGVSRLGYSAYEQSLHMIGISDPLSKDVEEILDTGTAIHRMVQANLTRSGVISKAEAHVYDPYMRISSYVDGIMKQQNGQELPLEIKTINAKGFQTLTKPKHKHLIQINSYMKMLGAPVGSVLYINREDPSQTREYKVPYSPKLWAATMSELETARSYASEWANQGYGNKQGGYSYLDRLQVLLNADPFSKEYREVGDIVAEQSNLGILDDQETARYENIIRWQRNMTRRHDMYPYRFQGSQLIDPDAELRQYNSNELIKAAAEYGPLARVAGNLWEKFTHLRSPIHTKLIGAYSPEEQYERSVLYGSSFYDWQQPIDTILEPWARGLKSTTDPVQGGMSFGLGGFMLAGAPGALAGAAIGAVYGTAHGAYRAATDTQYIPEKFDRMADIQQYFDRIKYEQAQYLWMATKDPQYQRQMQNTAVGWSADARTRSATNSRVSNTNQYNVNDTESSMLRGTLSKYMGAEIPTIHRVFDGGKNWSRTSRESNRPIDFDLGGDLGFGSPWKGTDIQQTLDYDALNIGGGMAASPYWDRPFFTAFLETPEPSRDKILRMVDEDFAEMLKAAWRHGKPSTPSSEEYFDTHYSPPKGDAIYSPQTNVDDWKYETIKNEGLVAHEFGIGWRDQLRSINNSPINIQPININAENDVETPTKDLSVSKVRGEVQNVLNRTGFVDATISIGGSPSIKDKIILRVQVNRDSTSEIMRVYNSDNRNARVKRT